MTDSNHTKELIAVLGQDVYDRCCTKYVGIVPVVSYSDVLIELFEKLPLGEFMEWHRKLENTSCCFFTPKNGPTVFLRDEIMNRYLKDLTVDIVTNEYLDGLFRLVDFFGYEMHRTKYFGNLISCVGHRKLKELGMTPDADLVAILGSKYLIQAKIIQPADMVIFERDHGAIKRLNGISSIIEQYNASPYTDSSNPNTWLTDIGFLCRGY